MSTPSSESDRVLAGNVVAVPEARQLDVLAGLLERRGASVLRCPLVGINDAPDPKPVVAWIERLIELPTDLVVFYTGEGIERLVGCCAPRRARDRSSWRALARTPKLTRGPKPKRALRQARADSRARGDRAHDRGPRRSRRGDRRSACERVAIQLYSEDQDRQLIEHFEQRGLSPDCVAPYVYASAADDDRVARSHRRARGGPRRRRSRSRARRRCSGC